MTQAQGPFAQLPYSLWTFPGLCPLERWLCATIIRLCWRPGPQAFSYRTLAKESGISVGSFSTTQHHEGMIPKLERLGLVKTYKPTDEEGHVLKGRSFLIEPTQHLWQLNQQGSVQPVNTSKVEEIGEGVYQVNTTAYSLNTSVQVVNTTAYSLNTGGGINLSQKRDESTPNIKIDTIDSNIHSLVVSADAESDGGPSAFLEKIISFEETLEEVRAHEGRSAYKNHVQVSRQVGHDGITSLTFEEIVHAQEDRKALLDPPSYQREEKEPEGLPRVVALLTPTTPEPTEKNTVSLSTNGRNTGKPIQMSTTQPPTEEEPTQNTLIPAPPVSSLSTKGAAKTPSPDKTDGKGKNKKVEPVPLCSSRTIRESIDALRGYALDQEGPMKHERGVIKEWCQKHTLEDYKLVVEHCTKGHCTNKEHQFWREGTNLASFFNADKLAKLTPGVLACTGHIPKPNAPPEVALKAEKKVAEWHPVDVITPRKGVEVYYPATGERYRNGQRIAQ